MLENTDSVGQDGTTAETLTYRSLPRAWTDRGTDCFHGPTTELLHASLLALPRTPRADVYKTQYLPQISSSIFPSPRRWVIEIIGRLRPSNILRLTPKPPPATRGTRFRLECLNYG